MARCPSWIAARSTCTSGTPRLRASAAGRTRPTGPRPSRPPSAPGGVRLDLGSGPATTCPFLGTPGHRRRRRARPCSPRPGAGTARSRRSPPTSRRCPSGPGSLAGVWASKCLQHIPAVRLPLALAGLHRALAVGGVLDLTVFGGDGEARTGRRRRLPRPALHLLAVRRPLVDLLVGAGFDVDEVDRVPRAPTGGTPSRCERPGRARCPTPSVPGCGCSCAASTPACTRPTPASASPARATGTGRRRWPAGIVTTDRSPDRALRRPRRGHDRPRQAGDPAGRRADGRRVPGRAGPGRAARGLAAAAARSASSGWPGGAPRSTAAPSPGVQPGDLGGVPVYVMPSTSGLNARVPLAELADHLRAAARPGRRPRLEPCPLRRHRSTRRLTADRTADDQSPSSPSRVSDSLGRPREHALRHRRQLLVRPLGEHLGPDPVDAGVVGRGLGRQLGQVARPGAGRRRPPAPRPGRPARAAPPASAASSAASAASGAGLRWAGLPSYQPPYSRHTLRTTNSGSS